jgi:hypothetical protein
MEDENRQWSAPEVVEALRAERFPLNEPDPIPGVRSSFNRLRSHNLIDKVGYGVYLARKWIEDPPRLDGWDLDDDRMSEAEIRALVAEQEAEGRDRARAYDPAEEPF